MRTRFTIIVLSLVIALVSALSASADGPKPDAPTGKKIVTTDAVKGGGATEGARTGAALSDVNPSGDLVGGQAEQSRQVERAGAAKTTGAEGIDTYYNATWNARTRIFWGSPVSNVYVQGETQSTQREYFMSVNTAARKARNGSWTRYNYIGYYNASFVYSYWHFVDSYLDTYEGRSYHFIRDSYNITWAPTTYNSGRY